MSNLLLHLSAWYDTQNPRVTVSLSLQEKQGRRFVEGPLGATAPWKQVAQHRTAACLQGIFVDIQEMHKIKHFSSRGAGATSSTDPAEEVINFVFVLVFFSSSNIAFSNLTDIFQRFFRHDKCLLWLCLSDIQRRERECAICRRSRRVSPTDSLRAEWDRSARTISSFLTNHSENILAERPTVNPAAQRSSQGLLLSLKNDVISPSFRLAAAPSILSKGPVPLASLWIKSP